MDALGDPKSWKKARLYAECLGKTTPPFFSFIKSTFGPQPLSMSRVPRSWLEKTYADALDAYLSKYYGSSYQPGAKKTEAMVEFLGKEQIGHLLALLYFFRKGRQVLKRRGAAWTVPVCQAADVGGALGQVMGRIGLTCGFFMGAARLIACALMTKDNPGVMDSYRKQCGEEGACWLPEEEVCIWGCTGAQVLGAMLPVAGLPAAYARDIYAALSTPLDQAAEERINHFRMSAVMTDCLMRDVDVPEIPGDEEFLMDEASIPKLQEKARQICGDQSYKGWLGQANPKTGAGE